MKRIICLWGGPGTGKSTTSAGIFNLFKKAGFNAEMNREYIKDWVWEGRKIFDGDQTYIFAKQARKERMYMQSGVDIIITDSPLALATLYGQKYDKYERENNACLAMLKQHHEFCKDNGYKVDHFFLVRQKEYNPSGRFQTEEEAKGIDGEIKILLEQLKINHQVLNCDDNVETNIFNFIVGK